MQNSINKLSDYKGKFNNAGVELKELGELIAIEFFDFITKEDRTLKEEFYRRLHYFKNLSEDKAFIQLQDGLFNTISKILKTVRIDLVKRMQKSSSRAYVNFLNIQKYTLSLVDIYEALQNKDNYYRLSSSDYYSFDEISICYPSTPTRKQYEVISAALKDMTWINEIEKDKNKIKNSEELFTKFNDLHSELEEKLQRTPIKLHVQKFEEFYYSCTIDYKKDSEHYGHPYGQIENKPKLEKIRNTTIVIIDDLIKFLKESEVVKNSNTQPIQGEQEKIFIYNTETGHGELRGKGFKLTDGIDYRKLFEACFEIRGKKLDKSKVVEILGLDKHDKSSIDPAKLLSAVGASEDRETRKKSAVDVSITNAVNKAVKTIRTKTGLSTKEFVNNGCNITLNI